LEEACRHLFLNHRKGQYRDGKAHINSIESVWAVLKRGHRGVYYHGSPKHTRRYINEFVFRLNEGNVRNHTMVRLIPIIRHAVGKRLTHKALTAK